jgi:hypothetical protein
VSWSRCGRSRCSALAAWSARAHLSQLAWFFSKLAVVTFGGAYAVLGYMSQDVVTRHGWLTAGQMLDGLGLAETTPGPLILVTEFVGFVAAHRAHPRRARRSGARRARRGVGHVRAVLPVDLRRRAALARVREWPRLQGALARDHLGGAGRDPEPRAVVRVPRAVPQVAELHAGPCTCWCRGSPAPTRA